MCIVPIRNCLLCIDCDGSWNITLTAMGNPTPYLIPLQKTNTYLEKVVGVDKYLGGRVGKYLENVGELTPYVQGKPQLPPTRPRKDLFPAN